MSTGSYKNWAQEGSQNTKVEQDRSKPLANAQMYRHNYTNIDKSRKGPIYRKNEGPNIKYKQSLKIASLSVRSMCEVSKRELLVEYMISNHIDVVATQETKIPQAAVEKRGGYILVFATEVKTNDREHWGVGWCYKDKLEPYKIQYTPHS